MPVALAAVDPSVGPTLHVLVAGNVTFREARDFQTSLLASPRLSRGTPMLCDARSMMSAPSAGEVRELAQEMAALVNVCAFRDMSEAIDWLDHQAVA